MIGMRNLKRNILEKLEGMRQSAFTTRPFRYGVPTVWLVISAIAVQAQTGPIDKQATRETVNLYHSLEKLSEKHTLFGHQHATEYGHGWSGDADRSDVKS